MIQTEYCSLKLIYKVVLKWWVYVFVSKIQKQMIEFKIEGS